jgi:hypothetical protein
MSYSAIGTPVSVNALGRPQLLILNTDPLTRELYTHALNLEACDVETAGDGSIALEWLEMVEFPTVHQSYQLGDLERGLLEFHFFRAHRVLLV